MGCDGKTIAMPGQRLRGFPAIRTFPAIERNGFVWVWTGDPALADPAKLPQLEWADNAEWAYGGGLFHINCDYRLMIDNLMDLTHETYVHSSSIGQKEIDETPTTTRTEGDTVTTSRFMENVMPPPFWRTALRGNHLADDVPVDRWQICRFTPPSHVLIEVGVAHARKGGRYRGAYVLRARRVRNLPHPRARRRAGSQGRVSDAGGAGKERPVPALLFAFEVAAAGIGSLASARRAEFIRPIVGRRRCIGVRRANKFAPTKTVALVRRS
jgi:hypothetical protein